MEIKIKKLHKDAKLPTRGSEYAAGYDLYAIAPDDTDFIVIHAHETVKVDTGLAVEIPEGYFGAIYARSGLATKQGLRPANCCGIIDSDYRGPVIVALHNDTDDIKRVKNGERIAQLIIQPFLPVNFVETDALTDTERGEGGFGSTGKE
ncbi:MAG: dUTP diphosphatase [Butyrivibrio sp.]|nr:dUTP diphosphatase [Butyrivibrio sp.]